MAAGAKFQVVAPTIDGVVTDGGRRCCPPTTRSRAAPQCSSTPWRCCPSAEGGAKLALQSEAVNFLRDAYGHLKVIAYLPNAAPMFVKGGLSDANPDNDPGLVSLATQSIDDFITQAAAGRIWAREPMVRFVP